MFKSVAELQQFMKDKGIRMVDFKMVDIDGRWRHLSIPVERFTEKTMVGGIGFDGSLSSPMTRALPVMLAKIAGTSN